MREGEAWDGFSEAGTLNFPPTFKYVEGTNDYDIDTNQSSRGDADDERRRSMRSERVRSGESGLICLLWWSSRICSYIRVPIPIPIPIPDRALTLPLALHRRVR